MTNIHMSAPTGPNSYELTTVPTATLSGRFTGRTLHLIVEPASGADWNLTGTLIDVVIAARPTVGSRLGQADGTYAFARSKYSYNYFAWFNMYNNGTISILRAKYAASVPWA